MAKRKLEIELVGDDRNLQGVFRRASRGARGFNKDLGKASGVVRGFGRSLTGIGAGFIGVAGVGLAVRAAIGEFSEMQKAAAQTEAVLRSTSGAAGVTADHVDRLAKAISAYSGQDDEAVQAGENLLLTFAQIRDAAGKNNDIFTQATKVTADLAQAMGLDMTKAALQVGKALNDPARGYARLQRIGVAFSNTQVKQIKDFVAGGRVMDAQRVILAELNKEFGGSAKAFGDTLPGKIARFRESLLNLGGTIAGELAPDIEKLTDRALKWIQNTQNQKRVRDAFRDVAAAVRDVVGAIRDVVGALGGWKQALTIAVGAWVGFKVAGIAAAVAVQVAHTAAAAGTAAAWRAALISTGFGALAVAAGIAAALIIQHWDAVKKFFNRFWLELKAGALQTALDIVEPFSRLPGFLGADARRAKEAMLKEFGEVNTAIDRLLAKVGLLENAPTGVRGPAGTTPRARPPGVSGPREAGAGTAFTSHTPEATAAKNASAAAVRSAAALPWREFQLAVAESTKTIADDLKVLRTIITVLTGRLATATTLKAKTEIVNALNQYRAQEAALLQGMRDAQRQLAEARRARQLERRNAAQFALLGLGPTGGEKIPGVKGLKKSLGSISDAVKGTFLDTGKTRSLLANIRKLLAGGLGKLSAEVRAAVKGILDDLDQQLKSSSGDRSTKFRKANLNTILAGLGLTADQIREIRGRLSGVGAGGTVHGTGAGAFGMALPGGGSTEVVIHHTTNVDGRPVEKTVTRRQQQRRRRNPAQKRGPFAGGTV